MVKVIGVRFKAVGKIYYFDPGSIELKAGDGAIVETARGMEYGNVVIAHKEIDEDGSKHQENINRFSPCIKQQACDQQQNILFF